MELSELPNDPKITVRFQAPHASDPSALLAFRPFNPRHRIFRHGVVTSESAGQHESMTPLRRPKADCPWPGPGPRGNEAIRERAGHRPADEAEFALRAGREIENGAKHNGPGPPCSFMGSNCPRHSTISVIILQEPASLHQ